MFGVPPVPEYKFSIYHDESGTYHAINGDRWLLHGMLFVPFDKQSEIVHFLQQIRDEAKYHDEIHYVKLGKSTQGRRAQCSKSLRHEIV